MGGNGWQPVVPTLPCDPPLERGLCRCFRTAISRHFSNLEVEAMSELADNPVTAALTFRVPQKIGWSVQCDDRSWTGNELAELAECLAQEVSNHAIT